MSSGHLQPDAEGEGLEAPAQPAELKLQALAVGDSASRETLGRLTAQLKSARALETSLPHLRKAVVEIKQSRFGKAIAAARKAIAVDADSAHGWHLLAIALDKSGAQKDALDAYERAIALAPENPDVINNLGRLAYRMKMYPQACALFGHYLAHKPDAPDAANNLACALRDSLRYDEAVEVLKPIIAANAQSPTLWNTLGTVLQEKGEMEQSLVFFDEAIRLEPRHGKALYNRAVTHMALGEMAAGLVDAEAAIPIAENADDRAMMTFARSIMLIASGDLPQGWDAYEARLDPHYTQPIHFLIDRPRWTLDTDIRGKHILVFGEQGLGDEVLFANLLPDLIEAVGPEGRITLAAEKRLIPLFRRSFPTLTVTPHSTQRRLGRLIRSVLHFRDYEQVDFWTPIGSLLSRFRTRVEDFPNRPEGFLTPDPERVAHWKKVVADELPPGPKAGLLWTSLVMNSSRHRYFPHFPQWEPILRTPGAVFVNLQYGDRAEELALAKREFGVQIWQPPGIDLKDDLDDLAALCLALDAIIGPPNATSNIAAACGAPVWLISAPGAWPRLGTRRYPWYPQARLFIAEGFANWDPVMGEVAEALAALAAQRR